MITIALSKGRIFEETLPLLSAAGIEVLEDPEKSRKLIIGTNQADVRVVLGGHFHYSSWSTFAGVPVSVASASCYTADPAPVERFVSGVDGHQAFSMLHLYADRVVATVVPLASTHARFGQTMLS